jgi:hypothetical protein
MNYLEKLREYENPLNFLHSIYLLILIFFFVLLKMPFVVCFILIHTLANFMEKEDIWNNNWNEDEDSFLHFNDEEEQIEDTLEELLQEKSEDYIYSEFVEFWDYSRHLIPSEFFLVDLDAQFENIKVLENKDFYLNTYNITYIDSNIKTNLILKF